MHLSRPWLCERLVYFCCPKKCDSRPTINLSGRWPLRLAGSTCAPRSAAPNCCGQRARETRLWGPLRLQLWHIATCRRRHRMFCRPRVTLNQRSRRREKERCCVRQDFAVAEGVHPTLKYSTYPRFGGPLPLVQESTVADPVPCRLSGTVPSYLRRERGSRARQPRGATQATTHVQGACQGRRPPRPLRTTLVDFVVESATRIRRPAAQLTRLLGRLQDLQGGRAVWLPAKAERKCRK